MKIVVSERETRVRGERRLQDRQGLSWSRKLAHIKLRHESELYMRAQIKSNYQRNTERAFRVDLPLHPASVTK